MTLDCMIYMIRYIFLRDSPIQFFLREYLRRVIVESFSILNPPAPFRESSSFFAPSVLSLPLLFDSPVTALAPSAR